MLKLLAVLVVFTLTALAPSAHGQAAAAGTRAGASQVGINLSSGTTDYVTKRTVGIGAYGTWDLTGHLGVEGDIHLMQLNTPEDFIENSYLAGIRYFYPIHRYSPYLKVLAGIGTTKLDDRPFLHFAGTPGSYLALGLGGGVDVLLPHHLNARADFEFQDWPGFKPNGLTPTVASVGMAYRFR
jgi:hypothetical protein